MRSSARNRLLLFALLTLAVWSATSASAQTRRTPSARPAFLVQGVRVTEIQMLGDVADSNPQRILRTLGLERGAPYDSSRVEAGRRELLEIGWLRSVDLLTAMPAPDSLVIVILLERAPRARVFPMLDLRADDRVVVGGQLYAWGRSGRGERFQLRVAGGSQEILQAEWIEPRPFLSVPMGMQFRAELFQELETAESDIEFDRLALHALVSIPHRGPRLELAGSVMQMRASDSIGTIATGDVDHLRRGAVDFVWGGKRMPFEWSALRGRLGVGATSGIVEYQDVHGHTELAVRLHNRLVVAAGWAYRDVRGTVPRYDRLHLGGGPTLRGHDYAVSNGDGGTWGGIELRVPGNFWSHESFGWTTMPVALHVFADAGTAWSASAPGAVSEATARAEARMRWSTGLGLTLFFRRAYPLRADLGVGDDGVWRADVSTSFPF